jgi:pentatricopeptide repeat protein
LHSSAVPELFDYCVVISAWGRLGEWRRAVDVFEQMRQRGVALEPLAYKAKLHSLLACNQHALAIDCLAEARASGVPPDRTFYSDLIGVAVRRQHGGGHGRRRRGTAAGGGDAGAKPREGAEGGSDSALHPRAIEIGLSLVADLLESGQFPSTLAALLLAKACVYNGQEGSAYALVEELRRVGAPPELRLYTMMIASCTRDGHYERALTLYSSMRAAGVLPTPWTLRQLSLLSVQNGELERTAEFLQEARERGMQPPGHEGKASPNHDGEWSAKDETIWMVKAIRSALAVLHEREDWQGMLRLHDELRRRGFVPERLWYSLAINACDKAGETEKALALFEEMTGSGGEPNEYHYSAVITACAKSANADKALELFQRAKESGMSDHRHVYAAIMQACANAGRWRRAADLFLELEERARTDASLKPEVISFNAVLDAVAPFHSDSVLARHDKRDNDAAEYSALGDAAATATAAPMAVQTAAVASEVARGESSTAARDAIAKLLWARALDEKIFGDFLSWQSRNMVARFDLHTFSCGAAEMAVRWWLGELPKTLVERADRNEPLPTLCIVTGRGNTRPEYQSRDLRATIEELLIGLGVPIAGLGRVGIASLKDAGAIYLDAEVLTLMAKRGDAVWDA